MNNMNFKIRLLFFVAGCATLLASCKVRTPDGVLSESKMENVLYDYHEAQFMAERSGNLQQNIETYTEAVLQKHGVTRTEFNESMKWYSRHVDKLYDIYDRLSKRYQNEAQAMGSLVDEGGMDYSNLSNKGDTSNIWRAETHCLLVPMRGRNLFSFHINADTSFKKKDRYEWHFHTFFEYKEGRKSLEAVIAIRYANDSITTMREAVYGEGDNVISVTAGNLPIKEVEGFLYLDEPWTESVKLCFVSRMSLVRFHDRKAKTEKQVSAADSVENAKENAKKAFIDSIQNSTKTQEKGDHFRPVAHGRAVPHKKD